MGTKRENVFFFLVESEEILTIKIHISLSGKFDSILHDHADCHSIIVSGHT